MFAVPLASKPTASLEDQSITSNAKSSSRRDESAFKIWRTQTATATTSTTTNTTATTKSKLMVSFLMNFTVGLVMTMTMSIMILMIPAKPAIAFVTTDQIERVVDGDTVVTKSLGRLRMIGMNTPETVAEAQRENGAPPECFGLEASVFTKKLLPPGTTVRVETDQEPQDKYGRSLAYVFRSSDGLFVNGELVKQGYARQRTYGRNTKYDDVLRGYEKDAQVAKKGLWGKCDATSIPSTTTRVVAASTTATATTSKSRENKLTNPGDSKNCKDFETYRDARAWYDKYFPLYGDVARLDGDNDGIPCENLPGAPKKSKM